MAAQASEGVAGRNARSLSLGRSQAGGRAQQGCRLLDMQHDQSTCRTNADPQEAWPGRQARSRPCVPLPLARPPRGLSSSPLTHTGLDTAGRDVQRTASGRQPATVARRQWRQPQACAPPVQRQCRPPCASCNALAPLACPWLCSEHRSRRQHGGASELPRCRCGQPHELPRRRRKRRSVGAVAARHETQRMAQPRMCAAGRSRHSVCSPPLSSAPQRTGSGANHVGGRPRGSTPLQA